MLAMNKECWACGYRYVHSPVAILPDFPRKHVAGIFAVIRSNATPEDVTGADLIHLGGQFTEYEVESAGIIREMLEEYGSVECNACGNSWPRERYEELRPVDASIGYCPSCGESGEVEEA